MKPAALLAVVVYFICVAQVVSVCPDKLANIVRWSAWSGRPTTAGVNVTITATQVILLDVNPPTLDHVDVYGTLVVDPNVVSIELTVSSLYVQSGGIFYLGSEECPLSNKVTITLVGEPLPGSDPVGLGTKVLGVLRGGTLEIHGKPRKPVWTVLSQTANINSTQITLAENVDWAVGETIVIATTDFETFNDDPSYPPTQNEQVAITSRPSANVVAFSPPLSYKHYGQIWTGSNGDTIDMRGEVGLVTRNILIRGDITGASLTQSWGGHVMMRDGGVARIEYAEVTKMGQKGEFGRYPLHFHNASTQPNSYLRGNSVHDTFQRCIVVHSTFNLRIQNNFAYRGMGHCYFIEDGNEQQNVFEHNLGVKALVGTLLTADAEPAMFWITNPLNHFYGNVAVGGKMGYWFSMPDHPVALSAAQTSTKLRALPNGDFVGNKAHSGNVGLFVDRGLENAKPGSANTLTSYFPTNWTASLALAAKMGTPIDLTALDLYSLAVTGFRSPARFIDFVAYKHVEQGMWGRGSFMHSYGAKLADNLVGCVWPGNANLMQKTVMVGETDNVGTYNVLPQNKRWWGDEEGRTRPILYFIEAPVLGYSSYDAGGGDLVIDINFHNYNDFTFQRGSNAGKVRKTGAITGLTGPNVIEPINRIYRAKFFNVQNRVFIREYYPWQTDLTVSDDAVKGIVWVDGDGSIMSGLPEAGCGKQIVGTGAHVRTSSCVRKADWNAWICPANANAHRAMYLSQATTATSTDYNKTVFTQQTNLHLQRLSDSAVVDVDATVRDSTTYYTAAYSYGTNVIVNNNYYVSLGTSNTFLSNLKVQINNMAIGEKVRMAFPFPSTASITVKNGYNYQGTVTQVSSFAQLDANTYFFDTTAGLLWVHFETTTTDYRYQYNIPYQTSSYMVQITADCADSATGLCTYSPGQQAPASPGATTGNTANLCETGGSVSGGVNTYTTKAADSYTILSDSIASPWAADVRYCNITTEAAYEGSSSLRCTYGSYQYYSIVRQWSSSGTPVYLTSYTHLQLAVKVVPGYGDIFLGVFLFNQSYAQQLPTQPLHNPAYTNDAGPITDAKWSIIRVPLSVLVPSNNFNLWGVALTGASGRPMEFYVDSIKFVSLTQTLSPISSFPISPSQPARVGPGPQFTYGTTDTVSTTGDHLGSDGVVVMPTFFSVALILLSALLAFN